METLRTGLVVVACGLAGASLGACVVDGDSDEKDASTTPSRSTTTQAVSTAVTIGKASATGDFAVAQADGSIKNPKRISLVVTAVPDQQVDVSYNVTCTTDTPRAKTFSDDFSAKTPVERKIDVPSTTPEACDLAANAQLEGKGELRVQLKGSEGE